MSDFGNKNSCVFCLRRLSGLSMPVVVVFELFCKIACEKLIIIPIIPSHRHANELSCIVQLFLSLWLPVLYLFVKSF